MTFTDLQEARDYHEIVGGWLLDLGDGVYMVTQDTPEEHRSFASEGEYHAYLSRMAASGYDETK